VVGRRVERVTDEEDAREEGRLANSFVPEQENGDLRCVIHCEIPQFLRDT